MRWVILLGAMGAWPLVAADTVTHTADGVAIWTAGAPGAQTGTSNTTDPEFGSFNRAFGMADFQRDPGYDFRQQEGQRGVEASAAARGGILSGAALKAITRYNQDFASNEYGNAYGRYNNDQTTRFNRLSSLAGTGQTATTQGIASGQALTGQLQAGVNNITSNNNAIGNARASQYAGIGNAISGAANSIGGYFGTRGAYSPYQSLAASAANTISTNPGIF